MLSLHVLRSPHLCLLPSEVVSLLVVLEIEPKSSATITRALTSESTLQPWFYHFIESFSLCLCPSLQTPKFLVLVSTWMLMCLGSFFPGCSHLFAHTPVSSYSQVLFLAGLHIVALISSSSILRHGGWNPSLVSTYKRHTQTHTSLHSYKGLGCRESVLITSSCKRM